MAAPISPAKQQCKHRTLDAPSYFAHCKWWTAERKPVVILGLILAAYAVIEYFVPLGSAIQIGADEGFNLAKATLCLKGFRLYTEVWNDQPPLHTYVITELLSHTSASVLGPRLLTVGFAAVLLASLFTLAFRLHGLATAAIATALVIASPGFVELSSSCMLEIPALATGLSALCVLLVLHGGKWRLREVLAGIVFGAALQIKFAPAILLPLAAFLVTLDYLKRPVPARNIAVATLVFCTGLVSAWVAIDGLTGQWAYLLHFQQSWASHFAAPKSFEYGSARDHSFAWSILLKNWDATIPACVGILLLFLQIRRAVAAILPLIWLMLSLGYFATHKPWWAYYYIHIAIPLCWCAAVGFVAAWQYAGLRRLVVILGFAFLACALPWMGGRLYYQIADVRNSPQTYNSLVLAEIQRFKPFTEWIYADDLVYSFHAGIPVPPSLAVVSLKRLWSGDMTGARIAAEVAAFRPGVILLRNHTREVSFQDLLGSEYRLVYEDAQHRLYAHRTISRKPD